MPKKRVFVSYSKITDELRKAIRKAYPNGFKTSLISIPGNKQAFTLDYNDTIYLVKVEAHYLQNEDEMLEQLEIVGRDFSEEE